MQSGSAVCFPWEAVICYLLKYHSLEYWLPCHTVILCVSTWSSPVQKALIHTCPKMFPLGYNLHIKVSPTAAVWATFWCYVNIAGLVIFPWNIKIGGFGLLPLKPQGNQNQNSFWMPKWLICHVLCIETVIWCTGRASAAILRLRSIQKWPKQHEEESQNSTQSTIMYNKHTN